MANCAAAPSAHFTPDDPTHTESKVVPFSVFAVGLGRVGSSRGGFSHAHNVIGDAISQNRCTVLLSNFELRDRICPIVGL